MAKTQNKTQANDNSITDFIAAINDEQKQSDAEHLMRIMSEISGQPAVIWGPSIVGFGRYHYKYASGREGDIGILGFSPRTANLTIYLADGTEKYAAELKNLGPHTTGKVCLYIKRLSDIDLTLLEKILRASYDHMSSSGGTIYHAE